MPTSVTMPQLGESVTEGTVTRWLKQEGDRVEADEPLLEVSTDKVDTEIPSPASGTLSKIVVAEDETVDVGAELAVIAGDGESSGDAAPSQPAAAPAAEPEPAAAEPAAPAPAARAPARPAPPRAPAAPAPPPAPRARARRPRPPPPPRRPRPAGRRDQPVGTCRTGRSGPAGSGGGAGGAEPAGSGVHRGGAVGERVGFRRRHRVRDAAGAQAGLRARHRAVLADRYRRRWPDPEAGDRKSTRLNSSHSQ